MSSNTSERLFIARGQIHEALRAEGRGKYDLTLTHIDAAIKQLQGAREITLKIKASVEGAGDE